MTSTKTSMEFPLSHTVAAEAAVAPDVPSFAGTISRDQEPFLVRSPSSRYAKGAFAGDTEPRARSPRGEEQ